MEAKKNPGKELGLQRNKFFLVGLLISISLAITAFEWRSVKENKPSRDYTPVETETIYITPITSIDLPKVPTPRAQQLPIKSNSVMLSDLDEIDNQVHADEIPIFEFDPTPIASSPIIEESVKEVDTVFFAVEKQPEPANGFPSFYQYLSKNLKYPKQAKKIGTEGKVIIEFIVNKNGELSDLKIISGIGSGCDDEALRVLALTKWAAGKQRGRPVRVKMVMPIYFKLSNNI
jgi:protein TonB